ncbi:helix-turn-helix domain-containing protein [Nocardia sp. NPDC051833]|uniref:TetR/AcrR family transcriptional regulator n=1 Tax=Nocardia sp. NPDC051833 TaxID=3155674 RepID=UPI0034499348
MLEAVGGEIVPDEYNGSLPRHRHNLSREQVADSQSARIINAAIELFGTRGYAATTVMDIAKGAGVSRKTFYEMFDSKQDVVVAAYRAFDRWLRDAGMVPRNPGEVAPPADLARVCLALLTLLSHTPAATRMFFLEVLGAGEEVRRRRDAAIARFVDEATPGMQALRAQLSPDLPPLSRTTVHVLVGGLHEMIVHHLVHHSAATLPDLAEEMNRLVFAVVAPTVNQHEFPDAVPGRADL